MKPQILFDKNRILFWLYILIVGLIFLASGIRYVEWQPGIIAALPALEDALSTLKV